MYSGTDCTEDDEREFEHEFEAAMQAIKDKTRDSVGLGIRTRLGIRILEERCSYELCCLIGRRETFRLGPRIYHEAPDDIMELIVSMFLTKGMGGMNVLRLVSKRLKLVVESCATRLTNTRKEDGPYFLPLATLGRCRRIEHIWCESHNLRSLRGCPDRLKTLRISNGQHIDSLVPLRECFDLEEIRINQDSGCKTRCPISDLSPLANCQRLKTIAFLWSDVVDISALSSMPRLQHVDLPKRPGQQTSIKDISPLSQCKELAVVSVLGSTAIVDLSPLKNLLNLISLDISLTQAKDLIPLATLPLLNQLYCNGIPLTTSLLPLECCKALKKLSSRCPISDLSPLANCQRLKTIALYWSDVVDISVLSLMPHLKNIDLPKRPGEQPSIKDISPLSQCKELAVLSVLGSTAIVDLSPLKNLLNLISLDISLTQAKDLIPLASLPFLNQLACNGIPLTTSLLPLERCRALKKIHCRSNAKDLAILQERMPHLEFVIQQVPVQVQVPVQNLYL